MTEDIPDPEDLLPPDPNEDQPTPVPAEPESEESSESGTLERVDGTTQEIRSYLMDKDPEGSGEDELLTTVREALNLLLEIAETQKSQGEQIAEMKLTLQHVRDAV
ncbi:hypothetical protein [Roseivivax sp. CAU 1761]